MFEEDQFESPPTVKLEAYYPIKGAFSAQMKGALHTCTVHTILYSPHTHTHTPTHTTHTVHIVPLCVESVQFLLCSVYVHYTWDHTFFSLYINSCIIVHNVKCTDILYLLVSLHRSTWISCSHYTFHTASSLNTRCQVLLHNGQGSSLELDLPSDGRTALFISQLNKALHQFSESLLHHVYASLFSYVCITTCRLRDY